MLGQWKYFIFIWRMMVKKGRLSPDYALDSLVCKALEGRIKMKLEEL